MLAETPKGNIHMLWQIYSLMLVGEFVSIICRINPFAWFFKKEIGLNLNIWQIKKLCMQDIIKRIPVPSYRDGTFQYGYSKSI